MEKLGKILELENYVNGVNSNKKLGKNVNLEIGQFCTNSFFIK